MNLSPEAFFVCVFGVGGELTATSLANKRASVHAKIAKKCRPSSHSKVIAGKMSLETSQKAKPVEFRKDVWM